MEVQVNSEISRLRGMKGKYRIWRSNETSDFLLSLDYSKYPGIYHQFLESRFYKTDEGEWIEHKLLLRGIKVLSAPDSLGLVLRSLGFLSESMKKISPDLDGIGLEAVDVSDPSNYYFLLYLISDGKDYNEIEKDNY